MSSLTAPEVTRHAYDTDNKPITEKPDTARSNNTTKKQIRTRTNITQNKKRNTKQKLNRISACLRSHLDNDSSVTNKHDETSHTLVTKPKISKTLPNIYTNSITNNTLHITMIHIIHT